ncbi:MAG: hypothetical protein K940chlam3_01609 [Chlamydiae bacterium]|nr:hypothetical protein [Chlamydiota bacterium]
MKFFLHLNQKLTIFLVLFFIYATAAGSVIADGRARAIERTNDKERAELKYQQNLASTIAKVTNEEKKRTINVNEVASAISDRAVLEYVRSTFGIGTRDHEAILIESSKLISCQRSGSTWAYLLDVAGYESSDILMMNEGFRNTDNIVKVFQAIGKHNHATNFGLDVSNPQMDTYGMNFKNIARSISARCEKRTGLGVKKYEGFLKIPKDAQNQVLNELGMTKIGDAVIFSQNLSLHLYKSQKLRKEKYEPWDPYNLKEEMVIRKVGGKMAAESTRKRVADSRQRFGLPCSHQEVLYEIDLLPLNKGWSKKFFAIWKSKEITNEQKAAIAKYVFNLGTSDTPVDMPPDELAQWYPHRFMRLGDDWTKINRLTAQAENGLTKDGVDSLLAYRELLIEVLVQKVNSSRTEGQELWATWAGSKTHTSDIDVNLKGADTEQAVVSLNKLFRDQFGHGFESGIVWNVNFFAQDFLPERIPKNHSDPERSRDKSWRSIAAKMLMDLKFKIIAEQDRKNQLNASLLRARIDLSVADWSTYVSKLIENGEDNIDIIEAISRTEKQYDERTRRIDQAKLVYMKDKDIPDFVKTEPNLTMAVENRIYEQILQENVSPARKKYNEAMQAVRSNTNKKNQAELEAFLRTFVDLRKSQSEACAFANEAYLTEGSVVGVVVNKQVLQVGIPCNLQNFQNKKTDERLQKLYLSPDEHYHMVNEQFGRIFHQFEAETSGDPTDTLRQAGKYIHRYFNAAKHLHNQVGGENSAPIPEEYRQYARNLEGLKKNLRIIKGSGDTPTRFEVVIQDDLDRETRQVVQKMFGLTPNEDVTAGEYISANLGKIKKLLIDWKVAIDSEYQKYLWLQNGSGAKK